jgi:hypothetical protein
MNGSLRKTYVESEEDVENIVKTNQKNSLERFSRKIRKKSF